MVSAAKRPPFHRQLRSATHGAHVRLNRHPLLCQLTRPALDLTTYKSVLERYWSFYKSAEVVIRDCIAEGMTAFNYGERYKTDWLAEDLSRLGFKPVENGCYRNGISFRSPRTEAELVGMLYPLEGSTLGGQVISNRLWDSLGLDTTNGGRFFNGYGEQTGLYWAEFLDYADQSLRTPEELNQACGFSQQLFAQFEAHLDGRD